MYFFDYYDISKNKKAASLHRFEAARSAADNSISY